MRGSRRRDLSRARLRKSALFPDARHTTPLDARMRASAPLDASATPSTTRARSLAPSTAPHRLSRARIPARVSRPPPPRASSRDVRDTDSRVPSLGRAVNDADTVEDILAAAARVRLSTDDDAGTRPHDRQLIHRLKRKNACSTALAKLAKRLVGAGENERRAVTNSREFARLCEGALTLDEDEVVDAETEGRRAKRFAETARAMGSMGRLDVSETIRRGFIKSCESVILPPRYASVVAWAYETCGIGEEAPSEVMDALRGVPFRFRPGLARGVVDAETLAREVPFRTDRLTTRDGRRVDERRKTCWMGEPHVGSYAYSGKTMRPTPMAPCVERLRDAVFEQTGERFDSCLINWYDERAACAYHTDPGMGTMYATDSVIVSIGETRRFSFRPLGTTDVEAHWIRVADGDCVFMFANCNDDYEHCVMAAEGEGNASPRASVVFKRSLRRPGGAAPRAKKKRTKKPRANARDASGGGRGGRGGSSGRRRK